MKHDMRMSFCTFFFTSILALSAHAEQSEFNASELQTVRSISQAILKVRGQKRRLVHEETQGIREDLHKVRTSLEQAAQVNTLKFSIDTGRIASGPHSIQVSEPSVDSRLKGWWKRLTKSKSDRPQAAVADEGNASRQDEVIAEVRTILESRREKLEQELPSFWGRHGPNDVRNKQIHRAIESLEEEVAAISDLPVDERREGIRQVLSTLNRTGMLKSSEPVDPTITSMTKHYRK